MATFTEHYGSSSSSATNYLIVGDTVRKSERNKRSSGNLRNRALDTMREVFLPQGYPDSVSKDYLSYQLWDTIQAFSSYITGTLTTHAMLKGAGVGDSSASPVAATLTWILKDGLGMIGRILFAWLKGSDLDCNAKRWRLVADVLNDMAMCIELLTPFFPSFFILLACLASITKALVGVAGGATRAALVQHQARRDNMADVSAKDGSQETLVNLAGLIIGLIITPLIAGRTGIVWILFAIFTSLHLFANFRAVSVVSMETLNSSRLHLLMKAFFERGNMDQPPLINSQEPLLSDPKRYFTVHYGVSLADVLHNSNDYTQCLQLYEKEEQKWIIHMSRLKKEINIAFHTQSNATDQLQAAVTAELLEHILTTDYSQSPLLKDYSVNIRNSLQDDGSLVVLCQHIIKDTFPNILTQLKASGWVTSHHLLGLKEWRYSLN